MYLGGVVCLRVSLYDFGFGQVFLWFVLLCFV